MKCHCIILVRRRLNVPVHLKTSNIISFHFNSRIVAHNINSNINIIKTVKFKNENE